MDSKDIAEQARMCSACPKMCRHVCPTFFAWRSDSPTPHGRALLAHQEIVGIRDIDDRGVEVFYQCLECSHCLTLCLPEIDIATIVEEMRTLFVSEGRFPSGLTKIEESIKKNHNPFDEPHSERRSWLPSQKSEGIPIIYFTGCTAAYREKQIAKDTVVLLSDLGYDVTVPQEEWCCGSPLLRTGFKDSGIEQAKHNLDILNSIKGELIVATCPGCYRVLTQDYPKHGLELSKPVKHISELLAERVDDLPQNDNSNAVTYHDPCHLGRHCGIYEPPRNVLEHVSGKNFIEMERNTDNAMCCGNGAGLRALFSDQAAAIGSERIRHAKNVGVKQVVTSCPFCKNMLTSQAASELEVLDLPEYVMKVKKANMKRQNK
ncbi:MAG: (Fe-S)-binding protein [Candidatus Thorarchaeota archaeon]|jgi:Fe-S oxidoreductase